MPVKICFQDTFTILPGCFFLLHNCFIRFLLTSKKFPRVLFAVLLFALRSPLFCRCFYSVVNYFLYPIIITCLTGSLSAIIPPSVPLHALPMALI